jgi:hypothetical protein
VASRVDLNHLNVWRQKSSWVVNHHSRLKLRGKDFEEVWSDFEVIWRASTTVKNIPKYLTNISASRRYREILSVTNVCEEEESYLPWSTWNTKRQWIFCQPDNNPLAAIDISPGSRYRHLR